MMWLALVWARGKVKIDVSDQIENEEQLLGLKNENNNESESKEANKELEEDEAKNWLSDTFEYLFKEASPQFLPSL